MKCVLLYDGEISWNTVICLNFPSRGYPQTVDNDKHGNRLLFQDWPSAPRGKDSRENGSATGLVTISQIIRWNVKSFRIRVYGVKRSLYSWYQPTFLHRHLPSAPPAPPSRRRWTNYIVSIPSFKPNIFPDILLILKFNCSLYGWK